MKAILISIKPKWVAKILNGEKTIEIRKTMPKCDLPIDVYIYCTKEEELFYKCFAGKREYFTKPNRKGLPKLSNGDVIAKFTLNKVEEIRTNLAMRFFTESSNEKELLEKSCLNSDQLFWYLAPQELKEKCCGYAWHISNLEILNYPKELSKFRKYSKVPHNYSDAITKAFRKRFKDNTIPFTNQMKRPPQSWCYVEIGE